MVYCPYTDKDLPESETTSEHIIPLALGGVNGFELRVDASFNSKVGSELDGSLANNFFWALKRTKFDARGQSGKEPTARIRQATYGPDKRLAQVDFHHKRGLRVWDVMDREYRERVPAVHIETSFNIDVPKRFTAKVALAAGYYAYGNLFRESVDHSQLREVMNLDLAGLDPSKTPAELGLDHLKVQVDDWLTEAPTDLDSSLLWLRLYCSSAEGSVVVLMPGDGCFGVGVGLLGEYLGMVIVPADTSEFPNEGEYSWGHVVRMVDKRLERCSWTDALFSWVEVLGDPHDDRSRKVSETLANVRHSGRNVLLQ